MWSARKVILTTSSHSKLFDDDVLRWSLLNCRPVHTYRRPIHSTAAFMQSWKEKGIIKKVTKPGLKVVQEERSWKQYFKSIVNNKEINTIPNMITISRIAATPFLAVAIIYDMKYTALGGCVLFGFTDWLDGYLANKLNQRTVLGAFLDPMADKVLITSLTVGLVMKGLFPLPLACLIVGRDLSLIAASFALRAIERPAGSHFFDTTDSATFNIVPSELSKINTAMQFGLLSATLCNFAFDSPSMVQLEPLWWITATTTLTSGLMYLDGSGRRKITRTMNEKVVVPARARVRAQVKRMRQKVKTFMKRSSRHRS